MTDLLDKYHKYLKLLPATQDKDGLIHSDECDSLGFSSLVGIIPDVRVNVDACRDTKTGQWHRRQVDRPCYPDHSKSTISRDMLLMLCWFILMNKRADLALKLYDYTTSHYFIMGDGVISRTYMTPNMLSTLGHLVKVLAGKNTLMKNLPSPFSTSLEDYQAHLAVLHMLLRKRMGVYDYKKELEAYKAAQPRNALFLYAAGYPSAATWILMDESLFPSDRLPTSRDRKAHWLWQRDMGKEWLPQSGDVKQHTGGDFLFVAYLILKDKGLIA